MGSSDSKGLLDQKEGKQANLNRALTPQNHQKHSSLSMAQSILMIRSGPNHSPTSEPSCPPTCQLISSIKSTLKDPSRQIAPFR